MGSVCSGKYRRAFWGLFKAALCIFLCSSSGAEGNPFEETIQILENRTSFHWGRDCFVWIVHYPEELVDPWVESEAGRVGMTESERKSYKEGFVSELSIGTMEPFLLTVYAFGPRPLDFAPISEKIALVTAEGERVKPSRYDRVFDQAINGVVQGLIFFPKQRDKDFALVLRGMGVYDERIFAFSNRPPLESGPDAPEKKPEINEENVEVVIVDLPPAPDQAPPLPPEAPATSKKASAPKPEKQAPKVIERPRDPPPRREVPPKAPVIVVTEPPENMAENRKENKEESMAEFVEALRSGDKKIQGSEARQNEAQKNEAEKNTETDSLYTSREKTLATFLELWVKHDTETMYSMLSESSQKLFSRETFESELRKASDFRGALQDGYTIDWLGSERAKVVAVKRILLIRTLVSRTLGVAREGSAWKIVW
ncbi:MAG: hypothetical protein LBP21_10380 [Synergistaceae bacterium]|jgi:hypothetical protein|nr:hypothetical protein [Synergistaceae bacterium]